MPDRQRHDEFIWALIFSLIINLLFVLALLAQRYVHNSPRLQPFVVSIAASQTLPGHSTSQSVAIPGPIVIQKQAKIKKAVQSSPALRPQSASIAPALPAGDTDGGTSISPAGTTEIDALPALGTAEENATPATTKESAAGLSIFGDKIAGDHYTAPEYLGGEKPAYPKRAERNGWEGTVLLNLWIDANGEVEKVAIAKTSGYEILDQQARASVVAWRFKPARRNGIAISVTVQQPVIFCPTLPKNNP